MSAILTRIFGFNNADLVEDIIQETFLSAMKVWAMKGEPENPEAWLMLVAKNKIINELNRKKRHSDKREMIHYETAENKIEELFLDHEIKDSQLRVLFGCCHPSLHQKVQIMLTLKVLSGFGDREIASALLMNPDAVKKGIYRARKQLQGYQSKIGIPFLDEVADRFDTVLMIVYLIFNEGYKTTTGKEVINEDLCYEAIRLAFLLVEMKEIESGKVYALLSLMYLSLARFPSRVNELGEMIDIENQDRTKWDKNLLDAGVHLLKRSRKSKELSRYHLEATIAGVHCAAPSYEDTDWRTIVYCYEKLMQLDDSYLIAINHAIALGKMSGPEKGLERLNEIRDRVPTDNNSLFFAAIAEMNMQLGNYEVSRSYYKVALDQTKKDSDKVFLSKKVMECDKKNINRN